MFIGSAVFIISLLALIAFLIESSRGASNSSTVRQGGSELLHRRMPAAQTCPPAGGLPRTKRNTIKPISGNGGMSGLSIPLRLTARGCSIPRVNSSSLAAELYRNNSSGKGVFQRREAPYRDAERRIPKDLILTRARQGADELEIAHGLGIGRDAVAMVLNMYGDSWEE